MEMIYVGNDTQVGFTKGEKYDFVFKDNCITIRNDLSNKIFIGESDIGWLLSSFILPEYYKPEPKQESQDLFQVGDVVYHWTYGKGNVCEIGISESYPVIVLFENSNNKWAFSKDGKLQHHQPKSLSFTPYNFKTGGFSQERPKPEPKVGDYGWFWNDRDNSVIFGLLSDITSHYYCEDIIAGFKYFSHEAPPHIAKHLKKSPNENQ